jgi:hypothetical protein
MANKLWVDTLAMDDGIRAGWLDINIHVVEKEICWLSFD